MSSPLNPVEVEDHIRKLVDRIAKGIKVTSERYSEFMELDREFDRQYAKAFLDAPGSVEDRKQAARLATMDARAARDVADGAFRHADRLSKALDVELRAYQSIGASIRSMYAVAGRGE